MNGKTRALLLCAVVLGATDDRAFAEEATGADKGLSLDMFGDIANSPTLTGDWGGTRTQLEEKGVKFDLTLTQVFQGVLHGGLDKGWQYGGRESFTLNLDTQKMGLWPGGFLMIEGEGNYGEFVALNQTGTLLPPNSNAFFPEPDGPQFDLVAFTAMQFISPNIGFMVGKFDTSSGDANAFAHGKGDRQFLNINFSFNPIIVVTAPYSTLGAGIIILPTGKPEEFIITASVIDTEGRPDTAGFDTVFKGATTFAAEGRYTTHFFDLTGHQLLGGTYSDRLYVDLDQRLANMIIPALPVQQSSGSWSAYYNFDQYIFQPDPKVDAGLGVFGRFGISDGRANPIHYFASVGIGGKGIIPGRKNDQFGIGYYRICATDAQTLQTLNFRDAQGFEAYYEMAITPALFITPDIQIVEPSQENVDTSVVLGVRLTMKF